MSRDVLQDVVGVPVVVYRAPSFSITKRSLWARVDLVEEGFSIDSSIFPIYHDRYGIPRGIAYPADPHRFRAPMGGASLSNQASQPKHSSGGRLFPPVPLGANSRVSTEN